MLIITPELQVALAIYMSTNAYYSWQDDPIITTVQVILLRVRMLMMIMIDGLFYDWKPHFLPFWIGGAVNL